MKHFLKIATAAILIASMLMGLSALLRPSLNEAENRWEYAPSNFFTSSLGRMPQNSLDVVFVGSSQIYSAISPMEMWQTQGIAGYCCATSGQTAVTSYYYLHHLLRRQTPALVVVDLLALFSKPSGGEFNNRSAVDNLPFSTEKIRLAWNIWSTQQNGESFFSYFLPVLRYHSRWKELKAADFSLRQPYDYARGYDMRYGPDRLAAVREEDFPFLTQEPTAEESPRNEASAVYFLRIAELCRERKIPLLLIRTPCVGASMEDHNSMQSFAAECGADFLDFNDAALWKRMDFHPEEDMLDAMHLNYDGTRKLSRFFAEQLRERYALPDRRGEADYAFWDRDSAVYQAELRAWQIQHCEREEQLRALTMNADCELLAVGMENANPAFAEALEIMPDPESMWIAHWDGEETRTVYTDGWSGNFAGAETEIDDTGIYMHGRNYMVGAGGLYYVIYDKRIGKIVDYGTISPGGDVSRE